MFAKRIYISLHMLQIFRFARNLRHLHCTPQCVPPEGFYIIGRNFPNYIKKRITGKDARSPVTLNMICLFVVFVLISLLIK